MVSAATRLTPPTPADFVARLNDLRVEKQLSYDQLGRRCRRRPDLAMSRSGIHTMLTGDTLPTKERLTAFLTLCEVSPYEQSRWLDAYEQVEWAPLTRPVMERAVSAEGTRQEPAPDTAQREEPDWRRARFVWPYRRYVLWQGVSVVVCSVVPATVAAIVLCVLGLPPVIVAGVLVCVAGGVAAWTLTRIVTPSKEHVNAYAVAAPHNLFDTEELVVVPVLGAVDETGR